MSFRFTGLFVLLIIRIIVALIDYLIIRNKEEKAKHPAMIILSAVLSVALISGSLIPSFIFADYDGLPVSGEYEIAETTAILIDNSRTEEFETDGSSREVPVYFYYPANAAEGEKFPLVLFSHGSFGYYQSNHSTYAELASNGYVVVSAEHPHHSLYTTDTNGNTIIVDPEFMNDVMSINAENVSEETAYEHSSEWFKLRAADMNFAIDSIKSAAGGNILPEYWYSQQSEDIVADVDPVLLIFIVPMVMVSLIFGKKTGEMYYKLDFSNTRDGRTGSYAKRVFYEKKYAGELRLFGIGQLLLDRHEKAYDEMQKRTREIRRKISVLETAKWMIYNLLSAILPYLYIAFVLNAEDAQTAAYIAMIPALSTLSWRTSDSVEQVVTLAKESAFVSNLRDFLSYEPKTDSSTLRPSPALDDIEIKNMSFTYDGAENPTLHNVNMTVKKGEKIAIVGHNGAGKTTFVKLIMGLYPVTEGEISISGTNINEYEPKSFHRRFGTVFQDLQVFALPLSHNVLMRKPKNDEERKLIEDSLRKAQFGDKLDTLEKGIDTMVTKEFDENGIGLSGGEAQKIAIARVFARKPDIVILDEPSSALDPIAEYNMYKNMLTAAEGETVIFISHRLSATRDADRIYMFENGTVIEEGSHAELMKMNGKYAEMWRVQAQNYLAEGAAI